MTKTQFCGQLFSEESRLAGRTMQRITRLSNAPRMERSTARGRRWAIILAGSASPLEQVRERAQRSVPSEQTIFAFTRAQEPHCLPELVRTVCQRLVQPCDRGTAPPILSALLQIDKAHPDVYVAILPSDHSYSGEDAFTQALETAFTSAASHRDSIVVLGAPADGPQAFQEKPVLAAAQQLLLPGGLWNTSAMVGHMSAFLRSAASTVPDLLNLLEAPTAKTRDYGETRISSSVYDAITPCDFLRQVLAPGVSRVLAMHLTPHLENPARQDLGHAEDGSATLAPSKPEVPGWLQGREAGKTRHMQPQTILLVDDDAAVRALVQVLLEKAGYRVLTAEDGGQALRIFETHRAAIGLILTDFRMPIVNGCELADRARQINAGVPVLVMTGDAPAVPPGYEFIPKPLKPAELIRHVSRVIDGSNARKGIAPALIAS